MKDSTTKTLLIVAVLAVVGVVVWLFIRGQKTAAKGTGVFGTVSAGASSIFGIAGGAVSTTMGIGQSVVKGTTSIVKDVLPWNW